MLKTFLRFLAVEILIIVVVIGIFQVIENHVVAGLVAGSLFVSLGIWILISGIRNRRVLWTFTFWVGLLHLCVSALPLFLTRLWNLGTPFESLQVLGLPGPVFHRLSTTIYTALLVATIIDSVISFVRMRISAQPKSK